MPVSRFYRQIPFITAFFASLLLFTGGVDILVRFCFLPDYVRQVFEYSRFRVQAQGGGGSSSSGQTGGSEIPTPSQPVSQSEGIDSVAGRGPNGLLVAFSWQTATTSYNITASRPSTNYVISRAESPDIIIASGTAAPLYTWIQSAEAADAMTNGGMTLKYQVPEGEVILTLQQTSSAIGLIEISLPSFVIPNKIYTVNYKLSRPLPDISQLPPDERPSIKLSIQSPHMGETTYYFPLESMKQIGQCHFVFHHASLKELNAVFAGGQNTTTCQFSYQLSINGDGLVVEGKSYPVDTTSRTGSFSLMMPKVPQTAFSGGNSYFDSTEENVPDVTVYLNASLGQSGHNNNNTGFAQLGILSVTGARDDDMLVAYTITPYGATPNITGMWPVSLVFGSNPNPQATRSVPLEKIYLPIARPGYGGALTSTEDYIVLLRYSIVRQEQESASSIKWTVAEPQQINTPAFTPNPIVEPHLNGYGLSGIYGYKLGIYWPGNPGITVFHNPLFPYIGRLSSIANVGWNAYGQTYSASYLGYSGIYPVPEVLFEVVYEPSDFYNTNRGTRLYTGRLIFSSGDRLEPPSRHNHMPLPMRNVDFYGMILNGRGMWGDMLTYPQSLVGVVMGFEIELRDKQGNPLHVEYDPVKINTGMYSAQGGMPQFPEGYHYPYLQIEGFKVELPDVTNCSAYPLFMKLKMKYRMPHRMPLSSPSYTPLCVDLWTNFPFLETVFYIPIRSVISVIGGGFTNPQVYYGPFGPSRQITNPCLEEGVATRIFQASPFTPTWIPLLFDINGIDPALYPIALECLNCPGPAPLSVPMEPAQPALRSIVISPSTINNLVKLRASHRVASERFTEFDFLHMKVTYSNGREEVFFVQTLRPPAIMGQHVPVVATPQLGVSSALARDANQACDPETLFFDNLPNSRTPCGIATRFYYPGFPTRRLVYMSYWGFPKQKLHGEYSEYGFGGIQDTPYLPNSYFRIGVAEHEAVPSSNSSSSDSDPWNFFEGFGTVYAISRSLDGNGQLNGPLYTMLPHTGSYHDPNIHSTLEHIVLGDPPVDQKSPGCPNFPDTESVTITPAEPPPTNFPTFVTVNVNAQNYDYGIISGGMEPVFFFRNGSYQVRIPGRRARRGITVTLYADSCPSATREFLFPPPPVRPAGWRIAADPSFPVVQSAPVVEGQRLYWQGPTFEQGLPVLKNLSSIYQEKFGNTLPEVPPSPVRQGVTQFLNTKPTGNRIATW